MTKSPINQEALDIAKRKGKELGINQQVRLYGGDFESSHTVFNFRGVLYIGMVVEEGIPYRKFFKNKPVVEMKSPDGKVIANMQKLILI